MGLCIANIFQYLSKKVQLYTVYSYLETALHVSGGTSIYHQEHINCIYSIWYLSYRYCYLPLSWKSWNWFECAVGDVRTCAPDDYNTIVRCTETFWSPCI